jgi:hypothetical protein
MYSVECERDAVFKSNASPKKANPSVPSAILSLFLALVFVRIGILLCGGQQGDNQFLMPGLPPVVADTGLLSDVSETIELMLIPFGNGVSAGIGKMGWADELTAEQERLESRMTASRFAHNRPAKFKGVTAWGRQLMKLQDRFKERLAKLLPTSVRSSFESQKDVFPTSTSLNDQKDESVSTMTTGSNTWSAKAFPGAEQAWAHYENIMQTLEDRKLARQQTRPEKRARSEKSDDLTQVLDEKLLKDMHWAQGVPGALQAETDHSKRVHDFESRRAARQQSRLHKRDFTQVTKNGFADFFQTRKTAQVQRRKQQTWLLGLPGASKAYAEHEQRMQEFQARKLMRQQYLQDKTLLAQATKDGFAEFFQARKVAQATTRKNKIWARDLPGEGQSYADHDQRMKEFEARKEARQQQRLEKHVFAQATKDGFAKFFQARKTSKTQMGTRLSNRE